MLHTQSYSTCVCVVARSRKPLSPVQTVIGKVCRSKRPAFLRNSHSAHRKLAIPDLHRPINTLLEQRLFWQLLPQFTKNRSTDWECMTREWNLCVDESNLSGCSMQRYLKSKYVLQRYAESVIKTDCQRGSSLVCTGGSSSTSCISCSL